MCGRFSIFAELGDLAVQFRSNPCWLEAAYRPSWNVAPTAPILAIKVEGGRRIGAVMPWGFTSSPRRSGGSSRPLFNARSETLTERPAFRSAFAQGRCLVPVNGFYEWRNNGGTRTPLWIHRLDERPFALAGIYNAGDDEAACVITCPPNSLMEPIHNRMPVVLDEGDYDAWLNRETEPEMLPDLLAPREWPDLMARPVSDAVNRPGTDGPQLIASAVTASPRLL
ncbi:MAG: SOS response-associated peptidase [Chloroflexi bacterium]|nr:SOS response-associated peptidase [Chloroflexota bacterium]MYD48881.1 SOS response-associated peptidase [Chloroflexota bacterium]